MDFVGKKKSQKVNKRDSSLKVVYISSPMKVKTSASKFRTIVQKLTGRDSDISSFMDGGTTATDFEILPDNFGVSTKTLDENSHGFLSASMSSSLSLVDPPRESPTSSDSLLMEQSFGDGFMNSQIEEQYLQEMFLSNLLCDSSQLDVLGSYDSL